MDTVYVGHAIRLILCMESVCTQVFISLQRLSRIWVRNILVNICLKLPTITEVCYKACTFPYCSIPIKKLKTDTKLATEDQLEAYS
jgi:hypothetical protein